MTADDLSIHYQRIARGIAQQLHRDGVVHNAPCVWGVITDALVAAHASGAQEERERLTRPLSNADAERLAEFQARVARYNRGRTRYEGEREALDEFLLRLLAEARGCPMMEPDRDEPERTAGWRP